MQLIRWGMATVVAGAIGAPARPALAEELTVLVTAMPPGTRTIDEGKADADQLAGMIQQEKGLRESLKQQFGKKDNLWPADKKAELEALAVKIQLKSFYNVYTNNAGAPAAEVESSAGGIRKNLDPKKGVRAVSNAEEADLHLEVMGRYLGRDIMDTKVGRIGLRVVAGGRLDAELLAKKPVPWPFHGSMMSGSSTAAVHGYTAEEPYWWIESERPVGGFGPLMFGKMESQIADALAKLLKEQGAAIAACRKPR